MFARTGICCVLLALVTIVQAQPPPPPARKKPVQAQPVPKAAPPKPGTAAKTAPSAPVPSSGMYVSRASIALDVIDREPKDTGNVFPTAVKRLYCFTEIMNGAGEEIQHRWYWNDDLINSVPLGIRSQRHRTYSAKTIIPGMVGEWRVAIVNTTDEAVLKTIHFQVK